MCAWVSGKHVVRANVIGIHYACLWDRMLECFSILVVQYKPYYFQDVLLKIPTETLVFLIIPSPHFTQLPTFPK